MEFKKITRGRIELKYGKTKSFVYCFLKRHGIQAHGSGRKHYFNAEEVHEKMKSEITRLQHHD